MKKATKKVYPPMTPQYWKPCYGTHAVRRYHRRYWLYLGFGPRGWGYSICEDGRLLMRSRPGRPLRTMQHACAAAMRHVRQIEG